MNTTGLSKSPLERMHQTLSGYVERQEMPGLVALVGHHADVHVETLGAEPSLPKGVQCGTVDAEACCL